ncbi:hypothetical protein C2S51_001619 [Perilla frutescens var. frutescens]|nr:hypothetical protein C2S51_001619 [Perilla frutescens var. frutescens]
MHPTGCLYINGLDKTGLWILYLAATRPRSIEIQLLYMAVIIIGFGRAGRIISLKEFLADQLRKDGSCEDEKQVESRRKALWRFAYVVGIFASLVIYSKSSWIQLCKISGIAMGASFILLLAGFAFWEINKPVNSSSLNNLLRVFYAAIVKRHLSNFSSNSISLRWLDKAAIVEPSLSLEEQVRRLRLCTVEQVEEAKSLVNTIPLCTTFLVYGLLQATGNTFFFEQANYTDNHLGHISNVPVISFVIIKTFTGFTVSWLCDLLFQKFWGENTPRLVQLVRVGTGMLFSPLCCLVACVVEVYRVHKYMDYNISISFLFLVPQFFLLGLMEGLVFDGLEEIYSSLVPASLNKYGPSFAEFALGIGHFMGLISVLIFRNLFKDDLDISRLGVYYRNLGFVCLGNLFLYFCIVPYYLKQPPSAAPVVDDQFQSLEESYATN